MAARVNRQAVHTVTIPREDVLAWLENVHHIPYATQNALTDARLNADGELVVTTVSDM